MQRGETMDEYTTKRIARIEGRVEAIWRLLSFATIVFGGKFLSDDAVHRWGWNETWAYPGAILLLGVILWFWEREYSAPK
jgi:hypothetical protein